MDSREQCSLTRNRKESANDRALSPFPFHLSPSAPRLSRRALLRSALGSTSLLAAGATLPDFLARTAWAVAPRRDDRILVVVQLTGGNDGLNMVAPYADDLYQAARPTLRVRPEQALRLDDHLGFNPEMPGLKQLFDQGRVGVVTNVGYPNPDRSHFRAMDIWHTADPEVRAPVDGWLGRFADLQNGGEDAAPAVLHLDHEALPIALTSRRTPVPSISNLNAFRLPETAGGWAQAVAAPRPDAGAELQFVQRVAVAACANARRIEQIAHVDDGAANYPDFGLAQRLRQIAELVGANFGPRVYYTSLGGFDTHARQAPAHNALLRELSSSIAAFQADLESRGQAERVVLMTFSEFGRRIAENAGQGTDHGVAAPLLLVGGGIRAGVHGNAPDLRNTLDGDVRHETDFRAVYSAVLEQWLNVDPAAILGRKFESPALFAL